MSVRFPRGAERAVDEFTRWLRRQRGVQECRGLPHRLEGTNGANLDGERHEENCCFGWHGGPFLTPPKDMTHDETIEAWVDEADEETIRATARHALDSYRRARNSERPGSRYFTASRTSEFRATRQAWLGFARRRGVEA